MENFNFRANTEKKLETIQNQVNDTLQEQTESKELQDQNFESVNQAFNQIQERIDELGGLEPAIEGLREANKQLSDRIDKMES